MLQIFFQKPSEIPVPEKPDSCPYKGSQPDSALDMQFSFQHLMLKIRNQFQILRIQSVKGTDRCQELSGAVWIRESKMDPSL